MEENHNMTVFASRSLPDSLTKQLNVFLGGNSFPDLYKSYVWERDTHSDGFPDIYSLEVQFRTQLLLGGLTENDIRDAAKWGKFPLYGRIRIKDTKKLNDLNARDTLNKSAMMWHSKHKRPDTEWG
jgi:hypothetical protein